MDTRKPLPSIKAAAILVQAPEYAFVVFQTLQIGLIALQTSPKRKPLEEPLLSPAPPKSRWRRLFCCFSNK